MMPGAIASPAAPAVIGLKVVSVFPRNHGTRYDSHQGVVMLFDEKNGVPMMSRPCLQLDTELTLETWPGLPPINCTCPRIVSPRGSRDRVTPANRRASRACSMAACRPRPRREGRIRGAGRTYRHTGAAGNNRLTIRSPIDSCRSATRAFERRPGKAGGHTPEVHRRRAATRPGLGGRAWSFARPQPLFPFGWLGRKDRFASAIRGTRRFRIHVCRGHEAARIHVGCRGVRSPNQMRPAMASNAMPADTSFKRVLR